MQRVVLPLALLAAGALGAGVGWSARGPADPAGGRAAPQRAALPDPDALAALRERLDLETQGRMELAVQVAALADTVRRLERALEATGAEEPEDAAGPPPMDRAPGPRTQAPGGVDVERLVAAGFAPARVEELRERVDAAELAQLDLRDRAIREGWIGTPRYAREAGALRLERSALRDATDDALYDWYLYTAGRPNRIVVADVMRGSAASEAGLEPGDLLLRYDDRAVFDADELRTATLVGQRDENVAVEVLRDGRRQRVFLPRGPLGIRLDARSVEPSAADAR